MRYWSLLPLTLVALVPAHAAPAKKAPAKKAPAKKAPAKKAPAKSATKSAAPKPVEPREIEIGTLLGLVPGNWDPQPPTNEFRLSQHLVPKATGDTAKTEFIVFYFGKGGGGTLEDNIKRWYGLMRQPDGGDTEAVAKRTESTREGLRITAVDIPGTYMDRPFPRSTEFTPRPDYRMLAAIVETTGEGGDGPYYLRIVGPAKSVAAAKPGWDKLMETIKTR